MASQSADTEGDRNQDHPLRPPVPSIRGKADRHPAAGILRSHVVLDDGRPRKQAARFQDLLQPPSHAYLTGRANAGYAHVTTTSQSPLVSLATTLSSPLSDPDGCLICQRLALAVVLVDLGNTSKEISRCFSITARFAGSHRSHQPDTARLPVRSVPVTIRQRQEPPEAKPATPSFDPNPLDRSLDRLLAALGRLDDAQPLFAPAQNLPRAGVLLAIPALVASGLLPAAEKIYESLRPSFYGLRTTLVAYVLLALLRIRRQEALKEYSPGELGRIVGLDRMPEVNTLRRKLSQLAKRKGSYNSARKSPGAASENAAASWAFSTWMVMCGRITANIRFRKGM